MTEPPKAPRNPEWMPDETWRGESTAPRDGTMVEVLPVSPGYVPPKRAKWTSVYEPQHNRHLQCWQDENGRYALAVGFWRPIKKYGSETEAAE